MPLTPKQLELVRATIPILENGGEVLTKHFYGVMLSEYPQVLPFFNKTHQAKGDQPRALARAVLMYAKHIDDLGAIGPLATQIIQKHVSLGVRADHYPIVGTCLLRAMVEVLGKDVANDDILDAWGAAYKQLADILIAAEEAEYKKAEDAEGGWRGERAFVIAKKEAECTAITSFHLTPADGKSVMAHLPGQYTCIVATVNGDMVRRNYSLSALSTGKGYRISVKKEDDGIVSSYLHGLPIDATVNLLPPAGEFNLGTVESSDKPMVFIAGGIGITPLLPMMQHVIATSTRPVYFLSSVKSAEHQAFQGELAELAKSDRFHVKYWYSSEAGRISTTSLDAFLPTNHADIDAYFVGPRVFMKDVKNFLVELGVPEKQCHFEFFGPASDI